MKKSAIRIFAVVLGIVAATVSQAQSSVVKLQSGNGNGAQDSKIYYQKGTASGAFSKLNQSDFTPKLSGQQAYILPGRANGWLPNGGLGNGSTAKWIGASANANATGNSALYAISFNLAYTATTSLTFKFTSDDQIGDTNNQGLFIDGKAIANTKSKKTDWNGVTETFSNLDLGILSAGTHTLYIDVFNNGAGPSGLMFDATLTQNTTQAVPEPATLGVLGLGFIGLMKRRRKD
jgi:PEP-CTERM motif